MTKIAVALVVMLSLGAYAYSETRSEDGGAVAPRPAAAKASSAKVESEGSAKPAPAEAKSKKAEDAETTDWTEVDWRKRLTRLQYHIMREAGTERAFTGKYWNFFKPGEYRCAGCGQPLFESDAKFESDCGWPSFDRTVNNKAVTEQVDYKIGYPRTEIRCSRCDSHLGHVFNDGPTATGQRYCMNSAAMKFVNEKQLKAEKEKAPAKEESQDDKKESTAEPQQAPSAEPQSAVAR